LPRSSRDRGGLEVGFALLAPEDDAVADFMARLLDGPIQERLVGDHPSGLDAAACRDDHDGFGVVDSCRQFVRREAAEDDGVHGTDPGAGEHGDQRLRHHRHVDDHPVALADAVLDHGARAAGGEVLELGVADAALGPGDRAVVNDSRLAAATGLDVAVHRIVAGVEPATLEPGVERGPAIVDHPLPFAVPMQGLGRLGPEGLGIAQAALVDLPIDTVHRRSPVLFMHPAHAGI
jgi:hypothetical protein